jgi:hypothetical protein
MKTTHTSGQLRKFLELLEQKDVNTDIFQARLDGILADVFDPNAVMPDREDLRKLLQLGPQIPEVIILGVDFSRTLETLITAGKYDYVNSDITAARFPIEGSGIEEFEFDLFHPNRDISSDDAIKEMKEDKNDPARPWEPAKIEHLLVFGEAHPDVQRKFPIVALGSVAEIDGDRHAPFLNEGGSKRHLHLYWSGNDWNARYRFLRVRKKVSAA